MHPISAALMVEGGHQKSAGPSWTQLPGIAQLDQKYWWDRLGPLFGELILVAPAPLEALAWEGLIVSGQYHFQAPLAAVRAALLVAQHEQLLIVDPALQLVTPEIAAGVAAGAKPHWDVIALETDMPRGTVPLVFHKRCLKIMDRYLAQTDYTMNDFYRQVRLHTMDINTITC